MNPMEALLAAAVELWFETHPGYCATMITMVTWAHEVGLLNYTEYEIADYIAGQNRKSVVTYLEETGRTYDALIRLGHQAPATHKGRQHR